MPCCCGARWRQLGEHRLRGLGAASPRTAFYQSHHLQGVDEYLFHHFTETSCWLASSWCTDDSASSRNRSWFLSWTCHLHSQFPSVYEGSSREKLILNLKTLKPCLRISSMILVKSCGFFPLLNFCCFGKLCAVNLRVGGLCTLSQFPSLLFFPWNFSQDIF